MGTIQANVFIALDGVVEAPETWHMSYFNDEMVEIVGAGLEVNRAFLLLHPVVVGKGQKLFEGDSETHGLELVESKTLSTGVGQLVYRPAA